MNYLLYSILALCLLHVVDVTCSDGQHATENFKAMVQRLRRTLDGRQMQDIANLRNVIGQFNEGMSLRIPTTRIPDAAFHRGIAAFLKQREGHFENSKHGKEKFDEKFESSLVATCSAIDHQVHPIMKDYNIILNSDQMIEQLDMDSLEWLTNVKICFKIMEDKRSLAKGSYEALIGKKYHRTILGRFVQRIIDRRRR